MVAVEVDSNQSAVGRVTSLPLVSSTYGLVRSVYCGARDQHPYLRSVCHAAEQGVRAITAVAMTTAMPILGKLEPQLAIANDLACKGLDQMEKTLPILHQPPDQIVANAKDAVSRATVSGRLSGAVDRTRAAVSGGVERVLSNSEDLMARYLPPGGEEEEEEEKGTEPESCEASRGSDGPSYYARLGFLSTRVRRRAYGRAQARVSEAKKRSQEVISQLPHTVDLIEYARKNIDGANRKVYGALSSLVETQTRSPAPPEEETSGHQTEAGEAGTLALARSLTHQLQTTCITLASGLQGLSRHLQQEARSLGSSASSAYTTVVKAAAAGQLPEGGRARLGQMKQSLDQVLDYLVNNTPLNWLVGPFYPRLNAPTPPPTQASSPEPAQGPSVRDPSQQAVCCPEPSCCGAVISQQEVCGEEMLTMVSQHAV